MTGNWPTVHDTCIVDVCDCTCDGCDLDECVTCPACGADYDPTPQDGGVTDPYDAPSYRGMS